MDGSRSGFEAGAPPGALEIGQIQEQIENASLGETSRPRPILDRIRRLRSEPADLQERTIDRLHRLGIPDHIVIAAIVRAKRNGAALVHEMASSGQLDLHAYFCLMADDLGLPFAKVFDHKRIMMDISASHFRPGRTVQVCVRDENGGLTLHMAPDTRTENQLSALFKKQPTMRTRFCICEPQTILEALEHRVALRDVDKAITRLHSRWPGFSAKETLIPWQAFLLGLFVVLFPLCLWLAFWPTLLLVHLLSIVLFGLLVSIRIAAWRSMRGKQPFNTELSAVESFPIYSVMVALHREAAVVPQLVRSMARLDWPSSRLEVFYLCEADDHETISALEKFRVPESHRIIRVPPALPRTKPKALNYGLEKCTGDFVVIYDAEDRPHQKQLKEAWSRFSREAEDLACLQSPLEISNSRQSWLSSHFAFEYAAHFHGLLPYLVKIGAPLPLGGTSNHFRRSALSAVLGWDPFNVTEDADLGIRFSRCGYRSGVLQVPTFEDAPVEIGQWIPQRTRWIKGWMQTLLVHNRNINETKIKKAANNKVFQILMIGFIMSPILYGISILELIYFIMNDKGNQIFRIFIIYADIAIFLIGHVGYTLLAHKCWRRVYGKSAMKIIVTLPAYWLLAGLAAWRAVWKLVTAPHQWEKTTHYAAVQGPQKSGKTPNL